MDKNYRDHLNENILKAKVALRAIEAASITISEGTSNYDIEWTQVRISASGLRLAATKIERLCPK